MRSVAVTASVGAKIKAAQSLPAIQRGSRPLPLHVAPLTGSQYLGMSLGVLKTSTNSSGPNPIQPSSPESLKWLQTFQWSARSQSGVQARQAAPLVEISRYAGPLPGVFIVRLDARFEAHGIQHNAGPSLSTRPCRDLHDRSIHIRTQPRHLPSYVRAASANQSTIYSCQLDSPKRAATSGPFRTPPSTEQAPGSDQLLSLSS
jgi:hypothetical protein